jgi:hypothetical protein
MMMGLNTGFDIGECQKKIHIRGDVDGLCCSHEGRWDSSERHASISSLRQVVPWRERNAQDEECQKSQGK